MEVRVSLASDGAYEVPYQARFEYRGQAKPPARKQQQVFDRLYQESDIRRRNKDVHTLSSPKFHRPRTSLDYQGADKEDIAQALQRKHAESQARLARLRAERDCEEAAQMQPAPRINPNSKEILEKAKRTQAKLAPQTPDRYNSSRSSLSRAGPNQSQQGGLTDSVSEVRLRIPQLKTQENSHSTVLRLLEQRRQSRKQPSQDSSKDDYIKFIRGAVQARSHILEHEEPPPDLLEMNVIDRNNYWMRQKEAKIEAARENKKVSEIDGCTFRPNLRTGRQLNSLSSQFSDRRLNSTSVSSTRNRSTSRSRSYAELHRYAKLLNPPLRLHNQ